MLKSCIAQASMSLGPVPRYGEGGHSTPLKPPGGPKKLNRFFRKKFSTLMPANDLLAFNLGNSLICF